MGFRTFRKIDISPAFVAFICAYYYFDPLETFVPFFLSIFLHEVGHLIALCALRIRIRRISFRMSGALIETVPLSYTQELFVSVSGPTVNFILLCLCRRSHPLMAFLNFCLMVYNLLPLYPLDGGRVIYSILHILLPQRIADSLMQMISGISLSMIIGFSVYLTCCWHAGLWPILLCAILLLRLGEMFLKEKRNFAYL